MTPGGELFLRPFPAQGVAALLVRQRALLLHGGLRGRRRQRRLVRGPGHAHPLQEQLLRVRQLDQIYNTLPVRRAEGGG